MDEGDVATSQRRSFEVVSVTGPTGTGKDAELVGGNKRDNYMITQNLQAFLAVG